MELYDIVLWMSWCMDVLIPLACSCIVPLGLRPDLGRPVLSCCRVRARRIATADKPPGSPNSRSVAHLGWNFAKSHSIWIRQGRCPSALLPQPLGWLMWVNLVCVRPNQCETLQRENVLESKSTFNLLSVHCPKVIFDLVVPPCMKSWNDQGTCLYSYVFPSPGHVNNTFRKCDLEALKQNGSFFSIGGSRLS